MDTIKMRTCSFLLPDPGGEVLREALDEIERLVAELAELKKMKLRKTCIHVNIAGDCSAIQRLKKERDEVSVILDFLKKEMTQLTFREREIIKLRYGLGDGYIYTLAETGRIFKVTRECVRQIEKKGKRKLEPAMRRWGRFVDLADR